MKVRNFAILLTALFAFVACNPSGNKENLSKQFDSVAADVKKEYAPDRREKTFEVELDFPEGSDIAVVYGVTTEAGAKEALLSNLEERGVEVKDSVVILPHPDLGDKTYGVTAQSVINFRYGARYSSESATQCLMGMPLRLLERRGNWTRAITPEGYVAWVSSGSIQPMNEEEYQQWKESRKLIVTTHYTLFRESPSDNAAVVSDGVWGNVVQADRRAGKYYKVILPNGKEAYVLNSDVDDFGAWLDSRNPTPENIIATARKFVGFPYMWGGTSIKAMDCSGFTKTSFFLNGIILERDASQQAKTGVDVDITEGLDNLEPGDLLFFGSKATEERPERVTHVGIYIGKGVFIHSATSVRINSLLPDEPNYYTGSTRLVRARRIHTEADKDPGIISIKNHPWYF